MKNFPNNFKNQHYAMAKFIQCQNKTMGSVRYDEYDLSAIVHYLMFKIEELQDEVIELKVQQVKK